MTNTRKTTLTYNKRDALKTQLDDFATFQWRGHRMFDDFGVFIINEEKGSLKFYNGPGFSNQYAKPQFSTAASMFLGVDFKQQTITMKVGVYWFSIEQYQQLLECLSPYAVNYLTFDFEPKYGYLVKLSKRADSPRHIVGYENEEPRYYTEMDLIWDVVGESCVRSNTAYEWTSTHNVVDQTVTWVNNQSADVHEASLISTPLVFELPLFFNNTTSQLALKAKYDNQSEEELFNIELQNLAYTVPGLPNQLVAGQYLIKPDLIPTDIFSHQNVFMYDDFGVYNPLVTSKRVTPSLTYDIDTQNFTSTFTSGMGVDVDSIKKEGYSVCFVMERHLKKITLEINDTNSYSNQFVLEPNSGHQTDDIYDVVCDFMSGEVSIVCVDNSSVDPKMYISFIIEYWDSSIDVDDVFFPVVYKEIEYSSLIYATPVETIDDYSPHVMLFNTASYNYCIMDSDDYVYLTQPIVNVKLYQSSFLQYQYFAVEWNETSNPTYQLLLRYDSETGLLYIQNGSEDTWHLLCYQTDNNQGDYLLKSTSSISRFKIPGSFDWPSMDMSKLQFILEYDNLNIGNVGMDVLNAAIVSYARKNVI